MAIPRNVLLAVRCFHLWTDFDITPYIFLSNIFDKFVFQHNRAMVYVTVDVRGKFFSLFWPFHLLTDSNITSHKCLA